MSRRELPYVWITTVTNRNGEYLENIVNNYDRQIYPKKRLCVILNSSLDLDKTKEFFAKKIKSSNIVIESMPQASLGDCLNRSVRLMTDECLVWAKMDDDDFYGPRYIFQNVMAVVGQPASIVGRRDMLVYIPELSKLFYLKNGGKNSWTNWVQGASLTINRNVFKKVKFPNRNKGEDTGFLKLAQQNGFRIYATNTSDYVVIRHLDNQYHTWKFDINKWLRNCIDLGSDKAMKFEAENHFYSLNNQIIKPYLSGSV